jgi:hypothetical protein
MLNGSSNEGPGLKHDDETCQEESRTNETDTSTHTGARNPAIAGRAETETRAREKTKTSDWAQGKPLKLKTVNPLKFFSHLRWLDSKPLEIEPYRQRIFGDVLFTFGAKGNPRFNLALMGRGKKNWKSADLIFAALYRLLAWFSPGGNQCYVLANDLDQANDDLELAKKLVSVNPILDNAVKVKQRVIERRDGKGFIEILPAQDVIGSHGKTYLFTGFDEIHGHKNWDLFEAMQLDPTRPDALMWVTSYASIYHRPGIPLFDLLAVGKKGTDPRMYFSWYAADYITDATLENALPEDKAARPFAFRLAL